MATKHRIFDDISPQGLNKCRNHKALNFFSSVSTPHLNADWLIELWIIYMRNHLEKNIWVTYFIYIVCELADDNKSLSLGIETTLFGEKKSIPYAN